MTKTIQVKGYSRKTRSGKTVQVKGYSRKYTPKNKSAVESKKVPPGAEFLKKRETPEEKWGPAPKWTQEDFQVLKDTQGMSLWQTKQYLKNRKRKPQFRRK